MRENQLIEKPAGLHGSIQSEHLNKIYEMIKCRCHTSYPKISEGTLKPRLGLQFKDDMTYFPSSVVYTTSSPSHGRDSSWLITKHS